MAENQLGELFFDSTSSETSAREIENNLIDDASWSSWSFDGNRQFIPPNKECSDCSDMDIGSDDTWSTDEAAGECSMSFSLGELESSRQKSWELNTEWKQYFM
ncbi:hypothetical protein TKK_0001699 [Trichogramma kaykai]